MRDSNDRIMLFNRDEWILKRRQERAKVNLDTEFQKAKEKLAVNEQCPLSSLTTPPYDIEASSPPSSSPYTAKKDPKENANFDGRFVNDFMSRNLNPEKTEKETYSLRQVNELRNCSFIIRK